MGGIDDLIRQMRQDEVLDREWTTPYQYAKAKGKTPQQLYQLARRKKLNTKTCDCGRTLIHIKDTDDYFSQNNTNDEESEDE